LQEQTRLQAEEGRLKEELNNLRSQADALAAAARKKN
jgi:cell division protein FtsB